MSWSFRNYNAFIREAREEFGISRPDAVDLYRQMRDELDRPLYGVDVERQYDLASDILEEWVYDEVLDTPVVELDADWLDEREIDYDEFDYLDEGVELEITADLEYEE